MTIKILLVDDHHMMRDGLRAVLSHEGGVEVIGEADNGRKALDLVNELSPDVVVMDIGMPQMNGIEATRQIVSQGTATRVIALSMYSDKRYVINMLEAGAAGYVLKNSACDDLLKAVQVVASGKKYLSPDITGVVVGSCVNRAAPAGDSAYSLLGAREREVLQLLAEGKTSRQIASQLHISIKTVETHRRNIMKKLGRHSIAELTKYAVKEGLTLLDS